MRIDIHSHVLPEVDDGARNWDMCLEMLKRSAQCGVKVVIATPHYIPFRPGMSAEKIQELCQEVQEKLYTKMGIAMDIYAGHEIYYSIGVIDRLKKGEALTLAGSRCILVEFKPNVPYAVISQAVKEFRAEGYVPVLAHVERYLCLQKAGRIEELEEGGALFQMNVEAFQGGMFDGESRWAKKLLLNESIDFLASDMHNLRGRPPMSEGQLTWLQKKLSPEYQEKLLGGNAERLLLK